MGWRGEGVGLFITQLLTLSLTHSLTCSLTLTNSSSRTPSLTLSLSLSLTHSSLTPELTNSLTNSPTNSGTHAHTHELTNSLSLPRYSLSLRLPLPLSLSLSLSHTHTHSHTHSLSLSHTLSLSLELSLSLFLLPQARLLHEAWDLRVTARPLSVRLVVRQRTGKTERKHGCWLVALLSSFRLWSFCCARLSAFPRFSPSSLLSVLLLSCCFFLLVVGVGVGVGVVLFASFRCAFVCWFVVRPSLFVLAFVYVSRVCYTSPFLTLKMSGSALASVRPLAALFLLFDACHSEAARPCVVGLLT